MRWFSSIIFLICLCHFHAVSAKTPHLKIGFVGPLSGPYASYGKQMWQGAELAVNNINQSGGVKGLQMQLIPLDDRCQTHFAMQQSRRLIEESQVQAVVGHVCSAASLATLPQYANARVLMITPSSTHNKITARGFSTIFRLTGRNDRQAQAAVDFLKNQLRAKRVAVLYQPTLYGKNLAELVIDGLTLAKITPVWSEKVSLSDTNFAKITQTIANQELDAVYIAGYYPEVGALARAMHHQKIAIPLISSDGIATESFVHAAGGQQSATATMLTFDPRTIQDQTQHQQGYFWHAYAAIECIAKAIDATDEVDGEKLSHWLHQHQVPTVLGPLAWDTNGDIMNGDYQIYIWDEHGQYRPISPS